MHFESLKRKLIFVNKWKAWFASHVQKEMTKWANQHQFQMVAN